MQNNPLTTLSVQQLKHALTIRTKIQTLETQLGRLVSAPVRAPSDAAPAGTRGRGAAARLGISSAMKARRAKIRKPKRMLFSVSARTQKPSQRGQLKNRIIQTLKAAGNSGVTVKDLAASTGRSYGNISVWFHTTAKGVKEIKKVAPGRFAWAS